MSQRSGSESKVGVAAEQEEEGEGVETAREVASRLNRSSSTLVLAESRVRERRQSVPALGTAGGVAGGVARRRGSGSEVDSGPLPGPVGASSSLGLPQGPGPLHIAAK